MGRRSSFEMTLETILSFMSKRNRQLFLISICLLIFLPSCFAPSYAYTELSGENGEKIFVGKKVYGISYDKVVAFITTDERTIDPDPKFDYVFNNPRSLVYRFTKDSLVIYTNRPCVIPEGFKSQIIVRQVEVDDSTLHTLLESIGVNGMRGISW